MEGENVDSNGSLVVKDIKSASCTDLPLPNFDFIYESPQQTVSMDCNSSPIPIACERGPFRYIDRQTLADCIENPMNTKVDKYIYLDCRLPYQYQQSHIVGSINLVTFQQMTVIYHSLQSLRCCLIFFDSGFKSIQWIKLFRNYDRSMNMGKEVPYVYSNIFLLNTSFDDFQKHYPHLIIQSNHHNRTNDSSVVDRHKKEHRQYLEEMKNLDKLFFSKPTLRGLIPTASFPCYNSLYKSNSKK